MLIIDTHCHAGESWFEPIELLLHQMDANIVEKAVLVQHRGVYDNSYLLECAGRNPGRFAVVALVDTTQSDAPSALESWAEKGAVGVRLNPTERSPGDDPLAVWRKAAELGLVVSSLGEVGQFASDEFRDLVTELPDLTIVVEHLAGAGGGVAGGVRGRSLPQGAGAGRVPQYIHQGARAWGDQRQAPCTWAGVSLRPYASAY